MLTKVTCTECGGNLKGTPFFLEWEYDCSHCDTCGNDNIKTVSYHFCSSKCLKDFVNKFHEHKHEWLVDERITGVITDSKTREQTVLKKCDICKIVEQRKATKQDIKDWQKSINEYFNEFFGDENETKRHKKPST